MTSFVKILLSFTLLPPIGFFTGCRTLPKSNFDPAEKHITAVTYNINWGSPRPNWVADYLKESKADIIFLQETHQEWEKYLTGQLRTHYPYRFFKNSSGAGGAAFLSKYPVRNVKLLENEHGWFPGIYGELETPYGPIQLLNVHFRPPLSNEGSATLSALYNISDIYQQEITNFLGHIDFEKPAIIAGDFNEEESGSACRVLTDSGFIDSLSIFDRKSITWNWKVGPGLTLRERYDHVFVNGHLKCSGARVDCVRASDHEPVFAAIIIPDAL